MEKLREDQIEIVMELRKRTENLHSEFKKNHVLLQWLVIYKFDIDKSEEAIKKYVLWRENNNIDQISEWDQPILKNYFTLGYLGPDVSGSPVWIIPYGLMDIKGIIQSVSQDDFVLYIMRVMEISKIEMAKQSKDNGKIVSQLTLIFDIENFAFSDFISKPVFNAIIEAIKCFQAYYPDILKSAYVINAPRIFKFAFSLIKPFLAQELQDKVHIYGTTEWKEEILNNIPPSILPVHWGGERIDSDGDTKCPSIICLGGKVPQDFYLEK